MVTKNIKGHPMEVSYVVDFLDSVGRNFRTEYLKNTPSIDSVLLDAVIVDFINYIGCEANSACALSVDVLHEPYLKIGRLWLLDYNVLLQCIKQRATEYKRYGICKSLDEHYALTHCRKLFHNHEANMIVDSFVEYISKILK